MPKVVENENDLIARASRGSENDFKRLISAYSRELLLHGYRMLGSYHDAEDAYQETLIRAWKNIRQFSGRGTFRSWLYAIATNVCLHELKRRSRRPLPFQVADAASSIDVVPAPSSEVEWFEPISQKHYFDPSRRQEDYENVKIAYLIALQLLTPEQRAVLILRDILDFDIKETAATLRTTPASVNSCLLRSRKKLSAELPKIPRDHLHVLKASQAVEDAASQFMRHWEKRDVPGIVAMLRKDAVFSMPPFTLWFKGAGRIGRFLAKVAFTQPLKTVATRANGQIAFGAYAFSEKEKAYLPQALTVLSFHGDRKINSLISFLSPWLIADFDLPPLLT